LSKREEVLEASRQLITGDRQDQYGPPQANFQNIASMWNIRFQHKLKAPLTAADVAHAMLLLKVARDIAGYKEDSAIDTAGYAALYAELSNEGPQV
jgi:hypothetical protein